MFGIQRKIVYRNSAVFRLFGTISFDDRENALKKENEKDINKSESAKRATRLATSDKITVLKRKNNFHFEGVDTDELTVAKKVEHKNRILLEFHGDEKDFINNLFEQTLEYYKKFLKLFDYTY